MVKFPCLHYRFPEVLLCKKLGKQCNPFCCRSSVAKPSTSRAVGKEARLA